MVTRRQYEAAEWILENIREEVLEIKAVFYLYEKVWLDTGKLKGAITAYELERAENQSIVDDWNAGKRG